MLASHNTLTYMRPAQWWARLCPWAWRCQTRPLSSQISAGIRYADIRVRYRGIFLIPCHGLVDLDGNPVDAMRELDRARIPYRLVLERGDDADAARLARDILSWRDAGIHPMLHEAFRKNGWRPIAVTAQDVAPVRPVVDRYFKPVDSALPWWRNICNIICRPSTIARYAARLDRCALKADKSVIYLIDLL